MRRSNVSAEFRRRKSPNASARELVNDFEAGLIEPDDFVERFSRQLGFSLEYGRFCDIWSSIFLPDPFIPEELLRALKARYRLLLLSNTNAIHFRMLEATYPLLRQFDEMILSYKVKALKPSPAIYREAIARSGCAAGGVLLHGRHSRPTWKRPGARASTRCNFIRAGSSKGTCGRAASSGEYLPEAAVTRNYLYSCISTRTCIIFAWRNEFVQIVTCWKPRW